MPPPATVEAGVNIAELNLIGTGPGSTYADIFRAFAALDHTTPREATLLLTPPAEVSQSRYRDNLTAALKNWLGCPLRGTATLRLTTDGKVAITKLSELPVTAKPL